MEYWHSMRSWVVSAKFFNKAKTSLSRFRNWMVTLKNWPWYLSVMDLILFLICRLSYAPFSLLSVNAEEELSCLVGQVCPWLIHWLQLEEVVHFLVHDSIWYLCRKWVGILTASPMIGENSIQLVVVGWPLGALQVDFNLLFSNFIEFSPIVRGRLIHTCLMLLGLEHELVMWCFLTIGLVQNFVTLPGSMILTTMKVTWLYSSLDIKMF